MIYIDVPAALRFARILIRLFAAYLSQNPQFDGYPPGKSAIHWANERSVEVLLSKTLHILRS